jgi:purine-nucleoside phosphorylase
MASGMGMPSIGIYSYELFNFYGVENIIRVGSSGSIQKKIKLRDIIIAQGACTDSNFASQYSLPGTFAPIADFALLENAVFSAKANDVRFHVGSVVSSDAFYNDNTTYAASWAKMGVLAIEMESAALYMTAARCGKRALSILTVSDNILTGEETTAEERQTTFNEMAEIALDTAARMEALL